jgi:hypothetical protein
VNDDPSCRVIDVTSAEGSESMEISVVGIGEPGRSLSVLPRLSVARRGPGSRHPAR